MAARIQRWLLLSGVCAVIGSTSIFVWNLRPWWGAMAATVMLGIYPTVIAVELGLAAVVARRPGGRSSVPSPSLRHIASAWAGECRAGLTMFCWEQPFRSQAEPDHLTAEAGAGRGVVLVHGLFCNRGFWNPWMRRLRALGNIPFAAVNLEPLFGSIDDYLGTLETAILQMLRITGKPPVIVAHSMGGLVVRRWLSEQCSSGRVHHVITIGTPHAGTWLARFAHTRNGREMSVDSQWLQTLQRRSRPEDSAGLYTCFYGNCDNVVFPPKNATLPGADNRLLLATAHVRLAAHSDVFNEVLDWLDDNAPHSAHGAPASPAGPSPRSGHHRRPSKSAV